MRVARFGLLLVATAGCAATTPRPPRDGPPPARPIPATVANDRSDTFPEGCYRADRVLGSAYRPETGLSARGLSTFRLLPHGKLERPGAIERTGVRERWSRFSGWTVDGDTLNVRLSNGFSGWALRVFPEFGAPNAVLVGRARYLTDVIVRDTSEWNRLHDLPVRITREPCVPPT